MQVDLKRLIALCEMSENKILEDNHFCGHDWECDGQHSFLDRGSNILAVAHIDTYGDIIRERTDFIKTATDWVIFHPSLDDRLGIFVVLYLLPQLGICPDVLLTTDEECCNSTASLFQPTKIYNWIVEFDRKGTDVVMYQYRSCLRLCDDLKDAGFNIGIGSYSDIVELDWMERGAFNVGIGYHFEHTKRCCMVLSELVEQLKRFTTFWHAHQDDVYEYESGLSIRRAGRFGAGRYGNYGNWTPSDAEYEYYLYNQQYLNPESEGDRHPFIGGNPEKRRKKKNRRKDRSGNRPSPVQKIYRQEWEGL